MFASKKIKKQKLDCGSSYLPIQAVAFVQTCCKTTKKNSHVV